MYCIGTERVVRCSFSSKRQCICCDEMLPFTGDRVCSTEKAKTRFAPDPTAAHKKKLTNRTEEVKIAQTVVGTSVGTCSGHCLLHDSPGPQTLFFWRRLDERDQSVTHAPTKQQQAQVPVITDHFRGGSRRTVRTLSTPDAPSTTTRELWQHGMRGGKTSGASMLAGRDLAGLEAHLVPWLWPSARQKPRIRPTTCRPLWRPGQPVWCGRSDREAQGN